jgi:hypothetical protein
MSSYPVTLCCLVGGHRLFFWVRGCTFEVPWDVAVRSLISKCDEFTCCPNSNGHVTFMQCGMKCIGGLLGRISLTPGAGGGGTEPMSRICFERHCALNTPQSAVNQTLSPLTNSTLQDLV